MGHRALEGRGIAGGNGFGHGVGGVHRTISAGSCPLGADEQTRLAGLLARLASTLPEGGGGGWADRTSSPPRPGPSRPGRLLIRRNRLRVRRLER
ncbi:hypothetical protein GCM10018773_31370 [Streptomyces candidus]|nr:hypothetical protein GCM10018773_31370 [Streptomyces candidus]